MGVGVGIRAEYRSGKGVSVDGGASVGVGVTAGILVAVGLARTVAVGLVTTAMLTVSVARNATAPGGVVASAGIVAPSGGATVAAVRMRASSVVVAIRLSVSIGVALGMLVSKSAALGETEATSIASSLATTVNVLDGAVAVSTGRATWLAVTVDVGPSGIATIALGVAVSMSSEAPVAAISGGSVRSTETVDVPASLTVARGLITSARVAVGAGSGVSLAVPGST